MKKWLFRILFILLILFLSGVFLVCAGRLYRYFSESIENKQEYNELSEIIQQARPTENPTAPTFDWSALETIPTEDIATIPESPYISVKNPNTGEEVLMLPEFEELYGINPDIVGWISIPGTKVDYPVVQRKDETDHYLYRNFYDQYALQGCIYAREQCDVFAPSDNIVIYGHRMQDGSMFATLANYTDKSYWLNHQTIQFDTLRGRHTYQIICVFRTTATVNEGFPYHLFVDAEYDSDLDDFWSECRKTAYYETGLQPRYGDKLITLSTCEYSQANGRLVVVAKRID